MITVICSSQFPLDDFKKHVIKTSGLDNKIEFLGYENKGNFSLTEIYNRGLKDAKNNIVVFMHHDITIETNQWGKKLLKQFSTKPEYSIIGVAGTKFLSSSGQWWENKRKMYGRVAHTHKGNTWLSSYSQDMANDIEEVVVVDGVFFAIDKTKAIKPFDETVEGFHFYDVTFCFDNYLNGTKIGVITNIRINHKSIGQTNDSWETNRLIFADKYKENLPVNIKKVIREGQKINVLIGCLNFNGFTGSELYVFELAKQLIKQGCNVSVCSTIGNPLALLAKQAGIKLFSLQEPPGFKLGDGKWLLNTADGPVLSVENTLYKVSDANFDILHLNHKPITEHLLRLFPDTDTICSIHSEVINLEEPVIDPQIKKYIAIRPEIKDYIVDRFNIDTNLVDVIYNPIDSEKFKSVKITEKRNKKRILFVGTIDYLRKDTIQDLIIKTKNHNEELWIVGKKNDTYLDDMIKDQPHVTYFPPTANVEKFIQKCDETAGILLGRTTIEGWLCGKRGWIYDVDNTGNILNKTLSEIPTDIDKFKSVNVAKQIIEEYKTILN